MDDNRGGIREPIERLMRPEVLELAEYEPVQPLERLSRDLGIPSDRIIKLDANENPYGCSPRVREALAAEPFLHHYPDPSSTALREAIARYVGVGPEHILAGAGADELIELVIRLFFRPGDRLIDCVPTFGMYGVLTRIYGGQVIEVPRRSDFSVDVEAVIQAVDDRTKVIAVCSPNNPTGNTTPWEDVERLLATGRVVLVDEAYFEFSGKTVAAEAVRQENLIVLRTFSKLCGLAGFRVGYGIFPLSIILQLWKIKQPYNVTLPAQLAARASLTDVDYLRDNVRRIVAERERLFGALQEISFLEPYPSEGNYIFCQVTRGDALAIKRALEREGIFIRYFNRSRLEQSFRITVGRPDQSDALLASLKRLEGRVPGARSADEGRKT